MSTLLTSLTEKTKGVSDNLQINYLDRTPGIKEGALVSVKPTFRFHMKDGSPAQSFDAANIILVNRKLINNEWTDTKLPCFAMNFKSTTKDDNRMIYYTMIFRNTTSDELVKEMINAHKDGSALDKSKALYSIIKTNGYTPSNFWESIAGGLPIQFAQYKRNNGQINFVDTKYYNEKIVTATTSTDALPE